MSGDSPDRELWNKRTTELVQKIRVSRNTETKNSINIKRSTNIKQKDASFYSSLTQKNDRSKNGINSARTKQDNVKTAKTQTLFSFFAPKMLSNGTTNKGIDTDKSIDINIEQPVKRVKYDTESVGNEINVKKHSIQISSKHWSSEENQRQLKTFNLNEKKGCEEEDQRLNLTMNRVVIIDDNDDLSSCPICGISLKNLSSKQSNVHVNNCLDSPLESSVTTVEKLFNDTPSLPLEPFSNNAEKSLQNMLFNTDEAVEQSVNEDDKLVIVEKQDRSETKPQSRKECPWYKKLPGTSITVDAFKYGKIPRCTAYFLSHFHSDHYGGLTSKWSHGLIYCSTVTGNLVIQQLKVARHFIHKLPMNEEVSINNSITVTLIDANHCPGSALFLFKLKDENGQVKRYLHTGDFRACPRQVLHSAIAQPQNPVVDILYLDTTYLSPQYCFPAQEQVINAVVKLVRKAAKRGELIPMRRNNGNNGQGKNKQPQLDNSQLALDKWFKKTPGSSEQPENEYIVNSCAKEEVDSQNDENDDENIDIDEMELKNSKILVVVGTYLIGKEKVFFGIAKAFRSKIYVTNEKRKMLMCQEIPGIESLLTNDPHQACVHVVSLMSIKYNNLCAYLESLKPTFKYVMAFRPTGWTYKGQNFSISSTTEEILSTPIQFTVDTIKPTFSTPTCQIFGVPYSEHSSFKELAAFVMSLNVKQIIPTVNIGSEKSRKNMNYWLDNWQKEKSKSEDIRVVPYNIVDHW